jgi:hypothetical protein
MDHLRCLSARVRDFIKNLASSMALFAFQATIFMLITIVIVSLIALPIAGLYFDGEKAATIIGFLSILILGPVLWGLHLTNRKTLMLEVDLYNHISVPYEKLLMTANFLIHLTEEDRKKLREEDRGITAKSYIESEIKPLLNSVRLFSRIEDKLIGVGVISLCTFVVCTGLVYLVSTFGDASFSYARSAMFATNSMVKGALFDFLEAYDLELLNVEPYSLVYRHLDFVIRMAVSIIVLGAMMRLVDGFNRRMLFNRKMKNQRSRADFLNGLRDYIAWKIDQTRDNIYGEVDERKNILNNIMLPALAEELGLKVLSIPTIREYTNS